MATVDLGMSVHSPMETFNSNKKLMFQTTTKLRFVSSSDKRCTALTEQDASIFMSHNQFYEESFHTPPHYEWTSNIWPLAYKHRLRLKMKTFSRLWCKRELNLKTSILVSDCLSSNRYAKWAKSRKISSINSIAQSPLLFNWLIIILYILIT